MKTRTSWDWSKPHHEHCKSTDAARQHLPRLRHPWRGRRYPHRRDRLLDRSRHRLGKPRPRRTVRRCRPRWPPVRSRAGQAADPGPGGLRLPGQRRGHGAYPGAVLRGQRARGQVRGDADRQPQPAGLQRLQDRGRRRDPGQRADPGPARAHREKRPGIRRRQRRAGRHPAALLQADPRRHRHGQADEGGGRLRQRRGRGDRPCS